MLRWQILDLVRAHDSDFGPTLACEKLAEGHGHKVSVDTLRQWMIAEGLWKPGAREPARIHQRRPRRPCRGELVQIDGSPHDWFEERVERANQTLQDHLVKGLRLRGIADIEAANTFLPEFIPAYNRRFAVSPQNPTDAHRPLLHSTEELAWILCLHHTRTLSKNLTFQFKNREYPLRGQGKGYRLRGTRITLCEDFEGAVTLLHKGHVLDYRILARGEPLVPLADEKSVRHTVEQAKARQQDKPRWKPPVDHPWRRSLNTGTNAPSSP